MNPKNHNLILHVKLLHYIPITAFMMWLFISEPLDLFWRLGLAPNLHTTKIFALLSISYFIISVYLNIFKSNILIKKNDLLIYYLIAYMVTICLMNLYDFSFTLGWEYAIKDLLRTITLSLGLFVISKNRNCLIILQKNSRKVYFVWLIISLIYFILVVYGILTLGYSLNFNNLSLRFLWRLMPYEFQATNSGSLDYLGIADKYAIITLIVLGLLNSKSLKVTTAITSFGILFILGSRTSFLTLSLIYLFGIIKFMFHSMTIKKIFLTVLVLLCAISSIYILTYTDINDLNNNIMLRPVLNRSLDESLNSRETIRQENNKIMRNNLILGSYRNEVKDPTVEGYTHDVTSYWQQYGLFFFVLIIGIYLSSFWSIIRILPNTKDYRIALAIQIMSYVGICMCFSRSYVHPYIWLALGISSSLSSLQTPKDLDRNPIL